MPTPTTHPPEQLTGLDDLRRTMMETAGDLRHAAARLDDAERRAFCAPVQHRPSGDLSEQFADLRQSILASLPDSPLRAEALLCLAAAKDKAAHAALTATRAARDHDQRKAILEARAKEDAA